MNIFKKNKSGWFERAVRDIVDDSGKVRVVAPSITKRQRNAYEINAQEQHL